MKKEKMEPDPEGYVNVFEDMQQQQPPGPPKELSWNPDASRDLHYRGSRHPTAEWRNDGPSAPQDVVAANAFRLETEDGELPSNMTDVQRNRQKAQAYMSEVDRDRARLRKKEQRHMWWRTTTRKIAALVLPTALMQHSPEDGMYQYERYFFTFYYDYLWRWLKRAAVTLAIMLFVWFTFPVLIAYYEDYKLAQPPPTTSYFDGRNIFIDNVRVPHFLDPAQLLDRADLEWVRKTPTIHLTETRQFFVPIEYTWRDGKNYNITIEDLRRAVPQDTGKTCFCAAHFGIPLDVVFYGKEMWVQPLMSGSPAFDCVHKLNITDALSPESVAFCISPPKGIIFMLPEGQALKMESLSERACVGRCNMFVHGHTKYQFE